MTGVPRRVAVQVGGHTVRLGCAADEGGEPWLVAERPGSTAPVQRLLDELIGPDVDELVIVHPPGWTPARVAAVTGDLTGSAGRLRAVSTPVAAAGSRTAVVLDVGHTGAEITRLVADGGIAVCRRTAIGGAHLDALLAGWLRSSGGPGRDGDSRAGPSGRLRERLSLLPEYPVAGPGGGQQIQVTSGELATLLAPALGKLVELVRELQPPGDPRPVLLIGGVARTPLLAQLLDEAGWPDVVVAERPEAAAVLGALRSTADASTGPPGPPARSPAGRPRPGSAEDSADEGADEGADREADDWFPPPARPRLTRVLLLGGVGAAAAGGLFAGGSALFPPPAAVAVPAGVLVQYGYRFDVPAGWEHVGGMPQRRRVLLSPAAAPEGSDLIAVERTPLGYDSAAERPRALAELRTEFDRAVAAGSALSEYRAETVAGRETVRYRQRDANGRTEVDWFVVLDRDAQLSVGCRHGPASAATTGSACALVVGSVRLG